MLNQLPYDVKHALRGLLRDRAFTFVALGVVDRAGRRPLMLLGSAGLAAIYLAMGFCLPMACYWAIQRCCRAASIRQQHHD